MNGANWSKRYPLIVESAARIDGTAIIDAEVVWNGSDGVADFDALHSRVNDRAAVALAFDLLAVDGEDLRRKPFSERKEALRKILKRTRRGIQFVEHTEGDGREMFKAVCKLGLEGIVSKKLDWNCFQETRCALSLGSIENLDQSQESESACGNSRHRWIFLI